jgi:hypothetical protein
LSAARRWKWSDAAPRGEADPVDMSFFAHETWFTDMIYGAMLVLLPAASRR